MEAGNYPKAGSPEPAVDGADNNGGGRRLSSYYECVFCKRGFTNAQALGGHMNIHRKDRGTKSRGGHAGEAASGRAEAAPAWYQAPGGYGMHGFPGASGSHQHGREAEVRPPGMSLYGEDLHLGLSLGRSEDSREVDLELRLGHHP